MKDQSIQKKPTVAKPPPKQKHKHKGGKDHKKKLKKTEKPEVVSEEKKSKVETFGPYPSANPYGQWQAVDNRYALKILRNFSQIFAGYFGTCLVCFSENFLTLNCEILGAFRSYLRPIF